MAIQTSRIRVGLSRHFPYPTISSSTFSYQTFPLPPNNIPISYTYSLFPHFIFTTNCNYFLFPARRNRMRFFYHWIALTDDHNGWWQWNYGVHRLPLDPNLSYWDSDLEEPATDQGCVSMVVGRMGWSRKWRVYNCHWARPYLCALRY